MQMSLKGLLLSAFALATCQQAHAASPRPVDTITCTLPGGDTFKHNVYAFSLDLNPEINPNYFTVYFSDSLFAELVIGSNGRAFVSCVFEKLPGTVIETVKFADIDTVGVGANVGTLSLQEDSVHQTYTEVTFSYTRLTVDSNAAAAAVPMSSKEDQAKALAAFKAKGISLLK